MSDNQAPAVMSSSVQRTADVLITNNFPSLAESEVAQFSAIRRSDFMQGVPVGLSVIAGPLQRALAAVILERKPGTPFELFSTKGRESHEAI